MYASKGQKEANGGVLQIICSAAARKLNVATLFGRIKQLL